MMSKNKALLAFAGPLALAIGLAGCSGSSDEAPAPTNMVEENFGAEEQAPEPLPIETPTPEPLPSIDLNATSEALPPPTTPSEDEQMVDDASATGMTARASRGDPVEEPAAGGNFSDRD